MAPGSSRVTFPRRVAFALALVLATVVTLFVLVNVVVQVKLGAANRVDLTLSEPPSGGGANYLLLGSDTRAFVQDAGDETAFGDTSDAGGQRSDTIMVLHTDPDSSRSLLVSFPRDLWVDIPGRGGSRINAAFNEGPQAVVDTLSANFGVPIHHYVEVNFDSFRDVVDAIGSVPVFFPAAARDEVTGLSVALPGCTELDGAAALAFVRSRTLELFDPTRGDWVSADAIPDLGRIGRQQAFLRELGRVAMDTSLTNPFKGNDIIDSAVGSLTLDDGFGRGDVFSLVDAFAGDDEGSASGPESVTIPTEPATRGGQSVLEATGEAEGVVQRLRDFETVVPDAPDASGVTAGDTSVRVLNGSGAEGAASTTLGELEALGFKGGGSTNASKTFQTTEVHHRPGDDDKAALVASLVTGPVELVEDDGVEGADVWLVIGRSFRGISQSAVSPSGPAPPAGIPEPASLAPVPGPC